MGYLSLMNETKSMLEVYAVLAQGQDYYDRLELVKIFGSKDSAEAFAKELRELTSEPLWPGDEAEAEYSLVVVEAYSVN